MQVEIQSFAIMQEIMAGRTELIGSEWLSDKELKLIEAVNQAEYPYRLMGINARDAGDTGLAGVLDLIADRAGLEAEMITDNLRYPAIRTNLRVAPSRLGFFWGPHVDERDIINVIPQEKYHVLEAAVGISRALAFASEGIEVDITPGYLRDIRSTEGANFKPDLHEVYPEFGDKELEQVENIKKMLAAKKQPGSVVHIPADVTRREFTYYATTLGVTLIQRIDRRERADHFILESGRKRTYEGNSIHLSVVKGTPVRAVAHMQDPLPSPAGLVQNMATPGQRRFPTGH